MVPGSRLTPALLVSVVQRKALERRTGTQLHRHSGTSCAASTDVQPSAASTLAEEYYEVGRRVTARTRDCTAVLLSVA